MNLDANLLVIIFLFGLIIGSFLNVVIYRLPIILYASWNNDEANNDSQHNALAHKLKHKFSKFNLAKPRSHCNNCANYLPFWCNIPIISFIFLKGRCYFCNSKIGYQYPIVELLNAILYVLVTYVASDYYMLVLYFIFISIVICLTFIDFNELLLPDELTLLLLWLGLLANTQVNIASSLSSAVIGAAIAYIFLWSLYWIFKLISKKDGLGYGDFKFFAAILAWFGSTAFIPILLIAPMLAMIYFIICLLFKKITFNTLIPFGPFLAIASMFVLFLHKTTYFEYFKYLII